MAGSSELELVTGYRGKAHVTADDARSYNAGTVGKGTYVLPEGDELAAEMVDSNTLRIQSGTLLAQGCQCRVRAGEYVDVKIRNGSQAMKRNDIVVARYEKQAAEPRTESMTLKVIEGTPTDGTAKDPDHVEGDILAGDLVAEFPLWRVPLDGITVGTPVPLYKKLVTLESIGDSVSQMTSGAWTYVKRADGTAECVCERLFMATLSMEYANGLRYANLTSPDFPAGLFASAPMVAASLEEASSTCWLATYSSSFASAKKPQDLRVITASEGTVSMFVRYHAVGRWK